MSPKIPKGEILWVTYYHDDKPKYLITSRPMRDMYFLYEVENDSVKKIAKAESPKVFEEKYDLRGK